MPYICLAEVNKGLPEIHAVPTYFTCSVQSDPRAQPASEAEGCGEQGDSPVRIGPPLDHGTSYTSTSVTPAAPSAAATCAV